MKILKSACFFGLIASFFSACKRDDTDRAEVRQEIEALEAQGWEFIEMVGEAHGAPESRIMRYSDASGELRVIASNSGANGYGHKPEEFNKTFKEDGFQFLEVKIPTSPADVYSLVFRRSNVSEGTKALDQQK